MFKRVLELPAPGTETFFLWGPRQTGKSTLLEVTYGGIGGVLWVDLLDNASFRRYLERPELLGQELAAAGASCCVIDEIQKVPALLDEVHRLIERRGVSFALCGSSARKVRAGHANLLGGRALRYELFGLSAWEMGDDFSLERVLNAGYLPRLATRERPRAALRAYVGDYLKEEVAAEGLVRSLPAFSEFLNVAALSDTELVNFSTIARECGVSSPTVKSYFDILVDTLLGHFLPAFTRRPKRRVIAAPKFYFADVGVVNVLAKRQQLEAGSAAYGKAFENWVHHELRAYHVYKETEQDLSYWRLASGIEVDFIVGDMRTAIEAKATRKVTADHLKGLRSLREDHPDVQERIVVSLEPRARRTEDGILILPAATFISRLWSGQG